MEFLLFPDILHAIPPAGQGKTRQAASLVNKLLI
jgi:hypothetical protein